MRSTRRLAPLALCLALCSLLAARAGGEVRYTVTFDDTGNGYARYHAGIRRCILAAGGEWSRHLVADATINVRVSFHDEPTMSGTSVTSHHVGTINGVDLFEQGCAAKILRHVDPTAEGTDAQILIGVGKGPDDRTGYLQSKLWFDPDPDRRAAPVPRDKIDACSAFLHEFGHIFAFNGFLTYRTGAPKNPRQMATYDQNVKVVHAPLAPGGEANDEVDFYFTGAHARAVYGGDVPLNFENYTHFGNNPPRPGHDLVSYERPELMNGVTGYMGLRYYVTPLDVAVLNDCGLPCAIPAPAAETIDAQQPTAAPAPTKQR